MGGIATLREEVSIGEVEGEEQYLFGRVAEIAAAPDGSIYVFDSQVPVLRKYDARGKFVRNLGRKGQGPGEYLSGGGLAVAPDGKVYLWDTGTWRINVYSPAGELVTSHATPSAMGANVRFMTSGALRLDPAGNLYYRITQRSREPGELARQGMARQAWVKMSPAGVPLDTLPVPEVGTPAPQLVATMKSEKGSASSSMDLPFAPNPLNVLSPLGYFITAFPSRYAFELPMNGKTLSVRRDVKPEPVTAAERAKEKDAVTERMKKTQPSWSWSGPDIPKFKSAFDAILVGAEGRIWIPLVRQTASSGSANMGSTMTMGGGRSGGGPPPVPQSDAAKAKPKPGLFDVFEPNGTYVGQVSVPAGVNLLYRKGDYAWGTALDEFDVTYVKRYKIQWR